MTVLGEAMATVTLRVNSKMVEADTAKGIEQGVTGSKVAGAATAGGGKAGKGFTRSFSSEVNKGLPAYAQAGTKGGESFGSKFGTSAGAAISKFSKYGAIGLAAAGVASVDLAVKFQASMAKIQTQAGASAADVKTLSNAVLGMKDVQQSPIELANSLYHLKSVGLDNVDAMKALRAASDLAAVGGAKLEETTNAIAGAWRSGIKGAQSFGQAAGTVNAIIGAGNMRMSDFIDAIGTGFLPSARSFGISLKSVGAALALMTDEGIPANVAATRLRMSFSLLAAPSGKAADTLKTIGVTGLELANRMRGPGGLVAAIGFLKQHLDASGLSASKQAILLSHAFGGGRSSSAILTLINNYGVLVKKQDQINHSLGKFPAAVVAQRKTASAQFHLLGADLERIGIIIGTKLLPVITSFVSFLLRTHLVIPIIVALTAVVIAATVAYVAAAIAAMSFATALTGGIALAVVALIAGIVLLVTHWHTVWAFILSITKTVWTWIKDHWPLLAVILAGPIGLAAVVIIKHWAAISGAAEAVWHAIQHAFGNVLNFIKSVFTGISNIVTQVVGNVLHAVENFGHALSASVRATTHLVSAVWRQFWESTVGNAVKHAFDNVTHIIDLLRARIVAGFNVIKNGVIAAWNATWAWVTSKLKQSFTFYMTLTAGFRHSFMHEFDVIRHGVAASWDALWAAVRAALTAAVNFIGNRISAFRASLVSTFNSIKSGLSSVWNSLWNTLHSATTAGVARIGSAVNAIKNAFMTPIRWVANNVLTPLVNIWDKIVGAVGQKNLQFHIPAFAAGGKVTAGTTPTADDVLIRVSRDETVVSAAHSAALAPYFSAVGVPGYAKGGKPIPSGRGAGQHPPGPAAGGAGFGGGLGIDQLIGKGLSWVTGHLLSAVTGALGHIPGAATGVIRLVGGMGKTLIGDAAKKIAELISGLGASGSAIVKDAMHWIGKIPYVWGGTAIPGGADCSGFVQAIYKRHGINAPRTSEAQGAWVRRSGPTPGGLAFYNSPAGGPPPGHVAIVGEGGKVISQGGGMGPQFVDLHAFPLMWTGVPPGGLGTAGGPANASAGQAQAYARGRLSAYGWGSAQMNSLIPLWNQESGWNRLARNPSSGAYGIPQALPPSKMGAAANPPTSSASAQINWGLGYIRGRYGSPAGAEAHEQRFHWYDSPGGSWMPPGASIAYNGTGRPEHLTPTTSLDRLVDRLDTLISLTAGAPARTGAATAGAITGNARGIAMRRAYSGGAR